MVSKLSRLWIVALWIAWAPKLLAEKVPIVIDGRFEDWDSVAVAASDSGDATQANVDFGRLWIAEDDRHLFVRVETGFIVDPSENNTLVLIIEGGSGRVLEWQLGNRAGVFRINGSVANANVRYTDIGFRCMPTLDTNDIELAVRLDARPDGSTLLFAGPDLRIRFEEGSGDRIPNAGAGVEYTLGSGIFPDEVLTDFKRRRSSDLRVATYNILNDNLFNPAFQAGFRRQLQAVQPDIIHFQEIRTNTAQSTRTLIQTWLPPPEGSQWFAAGGSTPTNDTITVSRYPILNRRDLYGSGSLSGNLAVLLDTEAELGTQLLIINTHLPSGAGDVARQQEVDAIMAFIRNAKEPGGNPSLDLNTPIVIAGDMNFVGRIGQLNTLLAGDISDNGLHGPDFAPDWDDSPLVSITPRHTDQRMGYTWRSDFENNFWPGQLDYLIYSDSVLDLVQSFVVHTPSMSAERLQQYGLQTDDSLTSDHLLFAADFRPAFVDTDDNGLPDYWERLTFGAIGTTTGAQDLDFDGADNLMEYFSGTDPLDGGSALAVTGLNLNEADVQIEWSTVLDRNYRIQVTYDFTDWSDLSDAIPGTGQNISQVIPRSLSDRVFYRILVD